MTISVLFVCLGNICRSPLAEAALRAEAEAITQLDGLPTDDEESELLKNKTITRFYALRNAGENVRTALRTAITEAREAIEMKLFLEMLSSGLGGGRRGGGGLLN